MPTERKDEDSLKETTKEGPSSTDFPQAKRGDNILECANDFSQMKHIPLQPPHYSVRRTISIIPTNYFPLPRVSKIVEGIIDAKSTREPNQTGAKITTTTTSNRGASDSSPKSKQDKAPIMTMYHFGSQIRYLVPLY